MKTIKFYVPPGYEPARIAMTDGRVIIIGEEPREIPEDLHREAYSQGAVSKQETSPDFCIPPESLKGCVLNATLPRSDKSASSANDLSHLPKSRAAARQGKTAERLTLSKLQKVILSLAINDKGRLSPAAVKADYYGFPLRPKGEKLRFNRSEIGHKRYRNASVAISLAFGHLVRKGLAVKARHGIELTEEGWKRAETLNNLQSHTRAR